jgi:formaldehyde dismutase / methanol dehydrogenase
MIKKNIKEFPLVYVNPTARAVVGWGAHEIVGNECNIAKIKKALIISSGLKGTGILDEINKIITGSGIATEIYVKVTTNPKDKEVMEAYQLFKEGQCDGVVSVGGGSSHDCGKAVRVVASNQGEHINKFDVHLDPPWMQEMAKRKIVTIPQVCVNTTAGTGAEISPFCCVTDTKKRIKNVIVSPGIVPNVGIVDPLLIRMMPQNIAAWTGFDALSHGFEGFVTKVQVPHSSPIMLKIIEIVSKNIREFSYNRMNHTACENMCWAESMGGVGMALGAGAGLVHGCSHQISGLTGSHHGLTNAAVTIPLERYNQSSCPERFAEMARAMGVDTRGMTTYQAADKWFEEIERLLKDLKIEIGNLNNQFGLQREDLKQIVTVFMNDFPREGNPRECKSESIIQILESLM